MQHSYKEIILWDTCDIMIMIITIIIKKFIKHIWKNLTISLYNPIPLFEKKRPHSLLGLLHAILTHSFKGENL